MIVTLDLSKKRKEKKNSQCVWTCDREIEKDSRTIYFVFIVFVVVVVEKANSKLRNIKFFTPYILL